MSLARCSSFPTVYLAKAVDYDGDGRRNLQRSVPDVLASTANLLPARTAGRQGEPWLEEVRVPDEDEMGRGGHCHHPSALAVERMGRESRARIAAA